MLICKAGVHARSPGRVVLLFDLSSTSRLHFPFCYVIHVNFMTRVIWIDFEPPYMVPSSAASPLSFLHCLRSRTFITAPPDQYVSPTCVYRPILGLCFFIVHVTLLSIVDVHCGCKRPLTGIKKKIYTKVQPKLAERGFTQPAPVTAYQWYQNPEEYEAGVPSHANSPHKVGGASNHAPHGSSRVHLQP